MLAIKKRGMVLLSCLVLLAMCGCAPPGPRALLRGERLIREGKYEQAVESLQKATRLLPKNAQAYNHLGLALHGNKQFAAASVAYQKALALDHKLAAARYNLGCLYLEQNDSASAVEQLTSYTLLQPNSADGWLKLGNAQLRARQFDAAEKSFKTALNLHPRYAEVFNGLGVLQLQRKRPQDALSYFNFALNQKPNYGPALLNAAVLAQQHLNNRPAALEKYRQYLALKPRAANWEAVSGLASRLDAELNPPVIHVAQSTPAPATNASERSALGETRPTVTAIKSNAVPAQTNPSPRLASSRPAAATNASSRTNSNAVAPALPRTATQTNQGNTNPFVLASIKAPPADSPKPPAITNKAPEIEVTRLPDELVVKPPEDISAVRPPILPAPGASENVVSNGTNPVALAGDKSDPKADKRSILSRINPFGGKPRPNGKEKSLTGSPEVVAPAPAVAPANGTTMIVAARPAPAPLARYTYLSPAKPTAGNRREAEKFFGEGIKAQQSGKPAQALASYRKATQLDPAYFEAYYNQGLAAYGLGNWKESLNNYEYALAVKPDSVDARYNFALALQQANYPQDAADELLEILNERQGESRAQLLLANLYARQLNQPKLARQYYLKVLEYDPRNPKAAEIRYWLAADP